MGPIGSGKTTLSKNLSKLYNIPRYELDCVVYDDLDNHRKRNKEEIDNIFSNILKEDSWIIEDVGRNKFIQGKEECDTIYYLDIPKRIVYRRVFKRWLNQKLGREKYNYPPTFYQLYDMFRGTCNYYKEENDKIKSLSKYKYKTIFLKNSDLDKVKSNN